MSFHMMYDRPQFTEHLLHSKSNRDSLLDFTNRLVALKNYLTSLLSQQAVLILNTHTDTLSRIGSCLTKNHEYYAAVSDGNEERATIIVSSHGGEEVVQMVGAGFEVILIRVLIIAGTRTANFWDNSLQQ